MFELDYLQIGIIFLVRRKDVIEAIYKFTCVLGYTKIGFISIEYTQIFNLKIKFTNTRSFPPLN